MQYNMPVHATMHAGATMGRSKLVPGAVGAATATATTAQQSSFGEPGSALYGQAP
jgi:hypothetical protein